MIQSGQTYEKELLLITPVLKQQTDDFGHLEDNC